MNLIEQLNDLCTEYEGGALALSVVTDLRAIIEQHKQEVGKNEDSRKESYSIIDRFLRNNLDDDSYSDYSNCLDDLYHSQPSTQPDIVAELVKALEDDAYAATFQSMAGYRTALIAKVKGVVG